MTTNLTIQTDDPAVIHQLTLLTAAPASSSTPDPEKRDPEGYSLDLEAEGTDDEAYLAAVDSGFNAALSVARDEILANFGTLVRTAQEAEQTGGNAQTEVMHLIDQRVSELKR